MRERGTGGVGDGRDWGEGNGEDKGGKDGEAPSVREDAGTSPGNSGEGGKRKALLAGNGQAVAPGIAVELGPIVVL